MAFNFFEKKRLAVAAVLGLAGAGTWFALVGSPQPHGSDCSVESHAWTVWLVNAVYWLTAHAFITCLGLALSYACVILASYWGIELGKRVFRKHAPVPDAGLVTCTKYVKPKSRFVETIASYTRMIFPGIGELFLKKDTLVSVAALLGAAAGVLLHIYFKAALCVTDSNSQGFKEVTVVATFLGSLIGAVLLVGVWRMPGDLHKTYAAWVARRTHVRTMFDLRLINYFCRKQRPEVNNIITDHTVKVLQRQNIVINSIGYPAAFYVESLVSVQRDNVEYLVVSKFDYDSTFTIRIRTPLLFIREPTRYGYDDNSQLLVVKLGSVTRLTSICECITNELPAALEHMFTLVDRYQEAQKLEQEKGKMDE